jgi:hypothetical protein
MREGRSRKAFRLKVEDLEEAVGQGFITKAIPTIRKLEDLVTWDKPERSPWKSFSVAAPGGRNADLRRRFDRILPAFVLLQTGKKMRGAMPPRGKPVSDWIVEEELESLRRQNADLIARAHVSETGLSAANDLITGLQQEIAVLTGKLSLVTPLRSTN